MRLLVKMPDGTVWGIPAEPIAEERAAYYAKHDAGQAFGPRYERIYKEEVEFALAEPDEIIDWATNNMNWWDVEKRAVLVRTEKPVCDYGDEWANAGKTIEEG